MFINYIRLAHCYFLFDSIYTYLFTQKFLCSILKNHLRIYIKCIIYSLGRISKVRYKQNNVKIIDRQWTDNVTSRPDLMRESIRYNIYITRIGGSGLGYNSKHNGNNVCTNIMTNRRQLINIKLYIPQ